MVGYWSGQTAAGIPDLQRDMRTVTLNVLASSVFREKYDFIGSANLKEENLSTRESFRDALLVVHKYIIHLMIVPYRHLTRSMMPKSWSKVGYAAFSLVDFMNRAVVEEKTAQNSGKSGSGGLVTSLVRALDHTSKRAALSYDETLGNIFMINFAGLDTTANVMAFMMMRLASEPSIQDWLYEEVVTITGGRPVEEWEYDLFPRFKRCYSVFLESLRLYPPVTGLPKMTVSGWRSVQVGDQSIAIPPGTDVFPMLLGIQTDPRYWAEPRIWKPSRWIVRAEAASSGIDGEQLLEPRKGTFFPWSSGPQDCIGKKVSQIEAVAVLATLIFNHRLHVKSQPSETDAQMQRRVEDCCDDNNFNILLEMNDAAKVGLECIEM